MMYSVNNNNSVTNKEYATCNRIFAKHAKTLEKTTVSRKILTRTYILCFDSVLERGPFRAGEIRTKAIMQQLETLILWFVEQIHQVRNVRSRQAQCLDLGQLCISRNVGNTIT